MSHMKKLPLETLFIWTALMLGSEVVAHAADSDLDARMFSVVSRVSPSGRRIDEPFAVAVAGGYGYTESVFGQGDSHSRFMGTLAAEMSPLTWLGFGLRLDGRHDSHSFNNAPSDSGWVGDPRIHVRADRALGPDTSIGARLQLWLPGDNAPSLKLSATTVDLLGTFSWAPQSGPWVVSANAGLRLDQSAASAPDAARLGQGDRLSLGVSDFNAVLVGLSGSYGTESYRVFAEWSWDVLVGSKAPPATKSPIHLGLGSRLQLNDVWAAEALLDLSPSGRPALGPMEAQVPVPPRVAILVGLVAHWGRPAPIVVAPPIAPPVAPNVVPDQPEAALATLEATIETGGSLPPGLTLTIRSGGAQRQATPDGKGHVVLTDLAAGKAEVVASAEGYEPSRADITLVPGKPAQITLQLRPSLPPGQIRGTVRSFEGRGVSATIRVAEKDGNSPAIDAKTEAGTFQVNVRPGTYEVTIVAPDYEPQTRTVKVEQNGVTVLNADLRRAKKP